MRCNQCGVENPQQVSFCQHCGNPLSAAAGTEAMGAKTSGTAIASFVMGLLCLTCVAWPFLFLPAIICGIIALVLIANNKGRLKGSGLAITGIVIPVVMSVLIPVVSMLLAIMMPALSQVKEVAQKVVCETNFKALGNAMIVYMNDYEGRFPTPDRWCDLMMETVDVSEVSLKCPSDMEGNFSYAVNEKIGGIDLREAPADLVVLFESDLGRNGVGGREDVIFRHQLHDQPGCNILFADGHVEFVTEDRIGELRWEPEQ